MTEDKNTNFHTANLKLPLYVSVYERLYDQIKNGEFKPGEKLPSENTLAKEFQISRGTLRQALMLLQEDGIIHNWQGKGNFVTEDIKKVDTGLEKVSLIPLAFSNSECEIELKEVIFQPATEIVRENLQLNKSKLVALFDLIFTVDQRISCKSIIFLPYEILSESNVSLEDNEQLKKFIIDYIDSSVVNAHTELRVVDARESVAEQLGIDEGKTLLCFYEIMYSSFEVPVIYSKSYFVPELYNFYIKRRKL